MRWGPIVVWGIVAALAPRSADAVGTEPPPATIPDAGLEAVGRLVDDEGVLSLDAAVAVFSTVVAPIAGVDPVDFGGPAPPGAAALAIRRLDAEREALDPDVVAALDAALAPQAGDLEVVIGGVDNVAPNGLRRNGPIDTPTAEDLGESIAAIVGELERRSGHELGVPVRARLVADGRHGGDAVATAHRRDGRMVECRIDLPRGMFGSAGAPASSANSTIVHELWHCFQYDVSLAAGDRGPLWVIEGQAEWVGETIVGGSPSSAARWDTWLLSPERSLFRRSYDAIGVYAVAESSGSDPFATMLAMLGQPSAAAVETLFGRPPSEAVLAVGSRLARVPASGPEWESFGPGITGAQGAPVLAIPDGAPASVSRTVGRFATLPVVLTVTAGDAARVAFAGGSSAAVELPGAGPITVAPGGSVTFCLRPDGCLCPDGSPPGGAALPAAGPGEGAAAIGAVDPGQVSVTVAKLTLEELCSNDLVGTWTVSTDVVLTTLTAPYGELPMHCDGPMVLTFHDDGTFQSGFRARCTMQDMGGDGAADFSGTYVADESTFTVSNMVGDGTVSLDAGVVMPMPMRFPQPDAVTAYTIVDDVLTITFAAPDGNRFTIALTRSA